MRQCYDASTLVGIVAHTSPCRHAYLPICTAPQSLVDPTRVGDRYQSNPDVAIAVATQSVLPVTPPSGGRARGCPGRTVSIQELSRSGHLERACEGTLSLLAAPDSICAPTKASSGLGRTGRPRSRFAKSRIGGLRRSDREGRYRMDLTWGPSVGRHAANDANVA
jgi:hypothetical protein